MTLRDFLRLFVLTGIFATPFIGLYVAGSMFFPFITGKNFAFRIIVEAILGAWVLLMFIDATYRPKFSWVLAAAGSFLAVMTVADFMGENPARSFWSNYERMEGLVTIAHLFLYFIIAGSVMSVERTWNWFWRTSLGASMIVATNAFLQLAGKADIHQSATRLDATFGNSAYLAVYALFHTFLAMFLFVRERSTNPWRYVYPVMAIINIAVLYYTQTRGSFLGLVGGTFLALLLVSFFDKEHPQWKRYAIVGVVGVVALIGLFIQFKDAAWIQASPTLQRIASISLTDSTTQSRFMIWEMSLEGFKERPILGWGQDNFLYVFSKYYNPKMWNQEPWFDRSHDVFFDWLIAGGILGLLSYLSLFGAVLYYLWFAKKKHLSVLERSILTGMLAGYFIHNIFVFDNLTSYIFFFAFLAYIHTLHAEESAESKKEKPVEKIESGDLAIMGLVMLVLTAGLIYMVNIRNISANIALIESIRPEGIMVPDGKNKEKIALRDVLDQELFGSGEALEQLVQIAVQTMDPRVPESIRQDFYELTASEFEKQIAKDPTSLRMHSFAATFYSRFGQYERALEHFKVALELSPKRQAIYLDLGMMFIQKGDYAQAEEVTKKGYELEPANNDARLAYATALIYGKKMEAAEALFADFKESTIAYDDRILGAYGAIGDHHKVIELVNEKIARGFASSRDYFVLATAYAELGQKQYAIAAIEKVMNLDPSLKDQGTAFIEQIKAGK